MGTRLHVSANYSQTAEQFTHMYIRYASHSSVSNGE